MDLRPASYFVLASLLDGPLHGYAIAARARELSDGGVRLTAGTLYGALERMTGQGLVQLDREATVEGRLRRYYRLSDQGRQAVVREADRLAAAARVVQRPRPSVARSAVARGGLRAMARGAVGPGGSSAVARGAVARGAGAMARSSA